GYELDIEQLFLDDQYSRISLPTYPFARERYWVEEIDTRPSKLVAQANRPQAEEIITESEPEYLSSYIHSLKKINLKGDSTDATTLQARQEMEKLLYQLLWCQLQSLGLFREKH